MWQQRASTREKQRELLGNAMTNTRLFTVEFWAPCPNKQKKPNKKQKSHQKSHYFIFLQQGAIKSRSNRMTSGTINAKQQIHCSWLRNCLQKHFLKKEFQTHLMRWGTTWLFVLVSFVSRKEQNETELHVPCHTLSMLIIPRAWTVSFLIAEPEDFRRNWRLWAWN